MRQEIKIAVIGPDYAGKTTFIKSVSDFGSARSSVAETTAERPEEESVIRVDYGRYTVDDELSISLVGLPNAHFYPIWKPVAEKVAGCVLIVDSGAIDTLPKALWVLDNFKIYNKAIRYFVIINKRDEMTPTERDAIWRLLQFNGVTRVIACNVRDEAMAKKALSEIVDRVQNSQMVTGSNR